MGIFSSSWLRKVWKEYDVRFTVMLSLVLQVVLIILGNRRKYSCNVWIKFFVWCAYLAADSVATVALGVLSNNLGDFSGAVAEVSDATIQLTAFWAPFLLLHLGGPDAVTAYALEDNELWLRHLLQVFVQTGVSVYVIYMAWTRSHLSFLSVLMFLAGLIKYGERTWALRSASSEKLRESLLKHQTVRTDFHQLYRDFKIKVSEGYIVEKETCEEMVDQRVQPEDENQPYSLVQAYGIDLTKRLFLDSTLTVREKKETHSIFKQLSFKNAFQVIETELALIYDLMYTKAPLLYTSWGLCLRLITFFLTFITLLLFVFLVEKHTFTKADLLITFFLLVGGISLEIYAAVMLISSDRFFLWFNMKKKNWAIFQTINSLPPPKYQRWSNKMTQYSLIKFSLKEKPIPCRNLFNLLKIEFKIEKWRSMFHTQVSEDLKKLIFRYLKKKAARMEEKSEVFIKILPTAKEVARASEDLEKGDPIVNEDLGKRILFWHIVTDVWYNLDRGDPETKQEFVAIKVHCKLIKQISRYMLYLLVVHPAMVSIGLAQTSFQDISDVVRDIASPAKGGHQSEGDKRGSKRNIDKTAASIRLADSYFLGMEGVLGEALEHIQKMKHEEKDLVEKWNKIGCIWLEILASAASKCKGRHHGQQLRSGGEFLTHVWLLMAHFGLTEHFLQPNKQEIVRLIAK